MYNFTVMNTVKVVIVGSSYSSAVVFNYLENYLTKARASIDLLLISEKPCFFLKSQISQFLSAPASVNNLCYGFRNILMLRAGVSFVQAGVIDVNFDTKTIKTTCGAINYDYLVLAPELDGDDFGELFNDSACFRVNSLEDIVLLKNHVIENIQKTINENNQDLRNLFMTYSVIGAKKEGLELVLSLSDCLSNLFRGQYPELKLSQFKINLIEEDHSILIKNDPFYNAKIFYNLNKKKISLYPASKVTKIEKGKIVINNTDEILSGTTIFSGNYKFSSLIKRLPLKKDNDLCACIDLYSKADTMENVFVIGESTKCLDLGEYQTKNIMFYNSQAYTCAVNIIAKINNNPMKPLKQIYSNDFLSLGFRNSLVEIKGVYLDGVLVWLFHQLCYIWYLVGLKTKIKAFFRFVFFVLGLYGDEVIDLYMLSKQKKQIVLK